MAKSDTEVLQELKEATARIDVPCIPLKTYHALIINLDPASTTTLEEYTRIIKR